MPTAFGEKIRELRKKMGWTLERLADESESSKSYIWELENKNPPRPSAEKLTKIASKLGVTTEYLLDESQESPGEDVLDSAFFREFRGLGPDDKEKIRALVKAWGKKE